MVPDQQQNVERNVGKIPTVCMDCLLPATVLPGPLKSWRGKQAPEAIPLRNYSYLDHMQTCCQN